MVRRCALFLVLLFANCALAQVPNAGFPKYGSFEKGNFDTVNRQNLNSSVSIPILHEAGRGLNFDFALTYNSLVWENNGTAWAPFPNTSSWGWNTVGVGGYIAQTETVSQNCIDTYSNFAYVEQNGTQHPFSITYTTKVSTCGSGTTGTTSGYATDDSGYFINVLAAGGPTVYAPDGTQFLTTSTLSGSPAQITQIKDANGNYMTATPVGLRKTLWNTTTGQGFGVNIPTRSVATSYTYADPAGTTQVIAINYQSFNLKTNFACGSISEYSGTASLPSSISLPNGQSYGITYEATPGNPGFVTGRVSKITLPDGGYIQYQYGSQNDGIECVGGSSDGTIVSLTRTVNDGSTSSVWQFSRTQSGSNWVTTETKPQMPYDTAPNQSLFTFNSTGQELSEQDYEGSSTGTLLRTATLTWAANGSPATRVINENSQESEVATTYDNFGNLTQMKEYDWGNGAVGSLLRTTDYTYLSTSAYTNLNILNRVTLKTISDSSGTIHDREATSYDGSTLAPCPAGVVQHDDTNYGCGFTARGNPTSVTVYTNAAASTGPITKSRNYDEFGNVVQADVDCCQSRTLSYSSATQYAFPDSVVSGASGGPQLTTSYTYNAYTGQKASETDPNNQTTSYAYDLMLRLTTTTRPDSTQITNTYNDAGHTVKTSTPVDGTNTKNKTSSKDGLSRTVTKTITDSSNTVYGSSNSEYDPVGNIYDISNPSTGTPQYWKEKCVDALNRPLKVVMQDGSSTTFVYSGQFTTLTDSAGKQRKYKYDGLSELAAVFEPDPTNGNSLTLETDYTYTVNGQLTKVVQGSQTRTFTYDDASRMTSQTTPEGGTTAFQYNNFDKMTQRTDNRGVITTYSYDTLNRLKQISYNVGTTGVPATPTVTYTYGTDPASFNNGRLLTTTDGAGSETHSYDQLGRTTQVKNVISGTTYTVGYQYNLAGQATTLSYPSTNAVTMSYDAIGRLSSVSSGTTTYANGVTYNAANQMTSFNYGNGVTATFGYSPDMMQETSISYAKGATNLFSQNYSYVENGGNDGEVTSVTDNVDAGLGVGYTYDALRRLSTAVSAGSTNHPKWGLSFAYDRYGNRIAQTVTAGSGPSNSVSVSASTNHISSAGYTYDADGNLTNDGHNTLVYDGENRLVSDTDGSGTATYVYNASGQRAIKTHGATTVKYIYDGNRPILEFRTDAPGSEYIDKEYVYLGNQVLAELSGGPFYYLQDRTSVRATTDANGNIVGQLAAYPFGENWYVNNTSTERQFTSYLRDSESGNDYAINREYVNRLARFSALDIGQPSSTDPQQFNRYSYVANDPINRIDPTGKDLFFAMDEECDPDFGDCGCDEFFDASCGFDEGFGGGFSFGPFGPGLVCTLCHQACYLTLAFELGLCSDACALGQTLSCVRCILIANQGFNGCQNDCDQKWYCNL